MENFCALKKEVIDRDLCTGCGTCIGMCPTKTLDFQNEEIIDKEKKCISCGMCMKVCPGKNFSVQEWSQRIYGEEYNPDSVFGSYQDIFNVRSCDDNIRERTASGGAVTQLLIDMLESHKVQGVVVTRAKREVPYEFEVCIATDREQILEAAQSKYMIIPVNRIIPKIKEQEDKIAFVGLPCQIQGMRKAMEQDSQLRKKIEVLISIFCGFNMEAAATDYLISKSHICKDNIEILEYRRKQGAETGFYVKGDNGQIFFVNKHGYTFLNLIFSPKRCWKCYDYSGEFADIAVGDAWDKGQGWSRVIVRTDKGMDLLKNSISKETLVSEQADVSRILTTQNKVISYKKKQIGVRKRFMKSFPEYGIAFPKQKMGVRVKGFLMYLILELFKTKAGKVLIQIIPFQLMVKFSSRLKGNEIKK